MSTSLQSTDAQPDLASAFFAQAPSSAQGLKGRIADRFTFGGLANDPAGTIPLELRDHPEVPGLAACHAAAPGAAPLDTSERDLTVGTVRMGFGHHRIAYSVYTWAMALDQRPVLHDLLDIDSPESATIAGIDAFYSRWSRRAADLGGLIEWAWGKAMQQGDLDSLRFSCRLAERVAPLMRQLPRDLPVISTYPLCGQIAVACGFERVVNLVVDNYPQHFLLVPGALNLVQSPGNHTQLLQLGMPPESLATAGAWVSHGIAANAVSDSALRIERHRARRPLRLLVPVGGAGAQRVYINALLGRLAPLLRDGRVHLLLNAGDHDHMEAAFRRRLEELALEHQRVDSYAALRSFCSDHALDGPEPGPAPVTLFHFERHFEAFSATDLLIRVCDVMATKPSELAFFPVPKLHIRRVGDHEAASALRSMELGDGTPECRTVDQAMGTLGLMLEPTGLLERMNEDIALHSRSRLYDGSRVAVERALSDGPHWEALAARVAPARPRAHRQG
jgi:hypothetical protein